MALFLWIVSDVLNDNKYYSQTLKVIFIDNEVFDTTLFYVKTTLTVLDFPIQVIYLLCNHIMVEEQAHKSQLDPGVPGGGGKLSGSNLSSLPALSRRKPAVPWRVTRWCCRDRTGGQVQVQQVMHLVGL